MSKNGNMTHKKNPGFQQAGTCLLGWTLNGLNACN